MRKFGTTSPFKNYQNRVHSPLRSPVRPTSPFRTSPFSRQPMSPLRSRLTPTKGTVTPTKYNTTNGHKRVIEQFQRSPRNRTQTNEMHRTIKSGMGLFQQLAQQHKIGSQKKQNRLGSYQTQPFQYSEQKSSVRGHNFPKNSFAALIQNVKEIESIQASKGHAFGGERSGVVRYGPSMMKQENPSYFRQNPSTNNLSFKTIEQSKQSKNERQEEFKSPPHREVNILESFGSPSPSMIPEPSKNKESLKEISNSSFQIEYLKEGENPENKEEEDSYSDVVFLIKRGSQRKKQSIHLGPLGGGDSVKISFEENSQSLNMSPFL